METQFADQNKIFYFHVSRKHSFEILYFEDI